ncbi:hypothetical protein DDT56_03075 [Brenneria corticis]|uniref:Uncharacterized protein n=1 Tax=Brenneria corticis TaxID=2173106 RepID=A0A2U1UBK2_9GAMM|nr:hypothetical protein DDT56_03075 [Brenneria sp. CFCC 11842]
MNEWLTLFFCYMVWPPRKIQKEPEWFIGCRYPHLNRVPIWQIAWLIMPVGERDGFSLNRRATAYTERRITALLIR